MVFEFNEKSNLQVIPVDETEIATIDEISKLRSETAEKVRSTLSAEFHEFGEKCMEHYNALLMFAIKLCGNTDTAKDLVSITMTKALRSFKTYDKEKSSLKTWLFRILRNTSITEYHRKDNSETEQLSDGKLKTTPAVPISAPNDILESIFAQLTQVGSKNSINLIDQILKQNINRIVSKPVANALNQLSTKYRTMLLLRVCFDLSYEEIANTLGIPNGSVMSGLHKAKAKLRENTIIQETASLDYGLKAA